MEDADQNLRPLLHPPPALRYCIQLSPPRSARAITLTIWIILCFAFVLILYFVLCAAEWANTAKVRLPPAPVPARGKALLRSEPLDVGRPASVTCSTGKMPRMQALPPMRTIGCP
jgi:hypothetical protein